MCGICGFISKKTEKLENLVEMSNSIAHRGPDDHGEEIYQITRDRCIGFAQRRLSILDLSEKGHQPMHSSNKRVSVVFNGEIYNYRELREELKDYLFISDCDTEVIVAAYLKWGIDFVRKLNGMFAIALLDRENGTVYLIRDRIGKKPLYYYLDSEENIVFASELKAIRHSKLFKQEINSDIVGRYLYRTYITVPDTIYKNTFKLEPGAILSISEKGIKKEKYWDVATRYNELKWKLITDYEEAKQELKKLLVASIKRRMIADVPLGAFLSGGYDSSLICAIAQEISEAPLKTFSIGFYDKNFDEAPYAKKVANVLGTNHTELYISEDDMLEMIDSIPDYYDEPFADSSQIPSMIISKLAKEQVSVVLSGDGGDELFGGYNIYTVLQEVQKKKKWGGVLRKLEKIPFVQNTNAWRTRSIVYRILSDDNNKEARTQGGVNSYFDVINSILLKKANNFFYEFESKYNEDRYDVTRMLLDLETSLSEDMLAKVDRASMRYALECRCPLLDKDVVEYSFKIIPDFKDDHGNKKRILKDITYEYIPRDIMDRPKAGFCIPQDKWLRGPLRERVMDWTNKDFLTNQGIFEPDVTYQFIKNYMETGDQGKWSGQNFSRIVWSYFIFQMWYEKYM
ncbi:MAG: asparagine synthase (glutamine-hydrolyzing) [Lachnospiraceae bacterium]|nr:asparagine synthase (glutamine-hydrolyzing) [Lachnospiraceae bacterium]